VVDRQTGPQGQTFAAAKLEEEKGQVTLERGGKGKQWHVFVRPSRDIYQKNKGEGAQ